MTAGEISALRSVPRLKGGAEFKAVFLKGHSPRVQSEGLDRNQSQIVHQAFFASGFSKVKHQRHRHHNLREGRERSESGWVGGERLEFESEKAWARRAHEFRKPQNDLEV